MKKAIIFSFLALSCLLMSCTADAIPTNAQAAEDIGGQSGHIPPPPPPPSKP